MTQFPPVDASIHDNRGDETLRYLSRSNRQFLAAYTTMKRRAIDMMVGRAEFSGRGFRWSCPEELVLFKGEEFHSNINQCTYPPMQAGNCFANAFRLALNDPTLRYYEGWAHMEGSFPTHHGWVVDHLGRVQDPTWLTVIRSPREASKVPPHNTNRCVYFGVHIPMTQHIGLLLTEGTVNLLATNDMVPEGLLRHGLDHFRSFAPDGNQIVTDAERFAVTKILDNTASWVLDEETGIFSREGSDKRWCGRTQQFID